MLNRRQSYFATLFALVVLYDWPYVELGCDLITESLYCQTIFFNQYSVARLAYPKTMMMVNKFYIPTQPNSTCQVQCLLKNGPKSILKLPQIPAPDFVFCHFEAFEKIDKLLKKKTKRVCYQGQCLTLQQIAEILGIPIPTPLPLPTAIPIPTPIPLPTPIPIPTAIPLPGGGGYWWED
ncbi:hypothetical protein BLOT_016602 [Blomia tropicalis]|nr:hypothetical protein BLOT_016602 [Blomia tropicalis]